MAPDRLEAVESLVHTCEGHLAPNEVIHVDVGMEALLPHQPGDRGRPAAHGQCSIYVAPTIDQDAEEGLGEGVGPNLAVGPGDIGAPEVGPLALFNESPPEVRNAGKSVRVGDTEIFPSGNTAVHKRTWREREINDDPAFPGHGFWSRHYGAALSPWGEGGHVEGAEQGTLPELGLDVVGDVAGVCWVLLVVPERGHGCPGAE